MSFNEKELAGLPAGIYRLGPPSPEEQKAIVFGAFYVRSVVRGARSVESVPEEHRAYVKETLARGCGEFVAGLADELATGPSEALRETEETQTRLGQAEDLLRRLLKWETDVFGGSEAPVWQDVRSFFGDEADEEDESICQDDDFCNCGCNAL